MTTQKNAQDDSISQIALQLHEYEREILPLIAQNESIEFVAEHTKLDSVMISRALQWLSNKELITLEYEKSAHISLDTNGLYCAQNLLPELRLLNMLLAEILQTTDKITQAQIAIPQSRIIEKGISQQELGAALGKLKSLKLISVTKKEELEIQFNSESIQTAQQFLKTNDEQQLLELLAEKQPLSDSQLTDHQKALIPLLLKRSQFITLETKQKPIFTITQLGKSVSSAQSTNPAISAITTEHILQNYTGAIRPFDVTSRVPAIIGGRIHPISAVIELIREIFVEMGFSEMQGPWVETSFWCMDSMWIPQDHPARDVQDTFFLGQKGTLPDPQLVQRVKSTHETGGDSGSKGYNYVWDPEKSKELILRTHTTATSFRTLAKIAESLNNDKSDFRETGCIKRFYVGKVFRNEAIDATHLPEFYQVEGFVMGDGLTLQHLLGIIKEFYAKLGFTKIKFKPTYNPYTESSIEALYFDEKRQKWLELINSGIFRPESLAPFGITKPIIAWGLGLERLAMLLLDQNRLKDMIGPTSDLRWLRNYTAPKRQDGRRGD